MKAQLKIFIPLLATVLMTSPINAENFEDGLKKQCQYVVYGNGKDDGKRELFLMGVLLGMKFMTQYPTKFYKKARLDVLEYKACQNALNNTSANSFSIDFMMEAEKLISKKYSKSKK